MKILSKKLMLAFVLLSVFAMATGSTAQNRERNPQPNRQEVEGMMAAYILSKLQDSLDLTDEQFGAMVVAQKKLSDTRRGYRRDRMQVMRQMRQTLKREQAGESELQPLLSELETLRDDFVANERSRYAAIDAILDIRQRARYRILEIELQRRLGEMMRQVRGRGNDRRPQEFP